MKLFKVFMGLSICRSFGTDGLVGLVEEAGLTVAKKEVIKHLGDPSSMLYIVAEEGGEGC